MWVEGLIYKLIKMKFPHYLIKIIFSKIEISELSWETSSLTRFLLMMVYPRAQFWDRLFTIFMIDLPTHMNTTLTVFADDTSTFSTRVFHSRAKSNVQSHLDKLHRFYQKWKFRVNVEKSEALLMQRSNRASTINNNLHSLEMNGSNIPYKKCVRFFWVTTFNLI